MKSATPPKNRSPSPISTGSSSSRSATVAISSERAAVAEKEKVYLLLENEGSQNIAAAQEIADILKMMPSKWVGFNWDPHNAYGKEVSFPDAYNLLPKKRMLNVQVKGKGVMPS